MWVGMKVGGEDGGCWGGRGRGALLPGGGVSGREEGGRRGRGGMGM